MTATIERFDRWARTYDHGSLLPPVFSAIHTAVLSLAADVTSAPEVLLDIGCGTGRLLETAGKVLPATALVGLDASAAMLTVARRRLPAERTVLVRGRAENLPFAAAS